MFVKRGRDLSLCRVQLDKQTNLRHDKKIKKTKNNSEMQNKTQRRLLRSSIYL